jgi:hypothetical protein
MGRLRAFNTWHVHWQERRVIAQRAAPLHKLNFYHLHVDAVPDAMTLVKDTAQTPAAARQRTASHQLALPASGAAGFQRANASARTAEHRSCHCAAPAQPPTVHRQYAVSTARAQTRAGCPSQPPLSPGARTVAAAYPVRP